MTCEALRATVCRSNLSNYAPEFFIYLSCHRIEGCIIAFYDRQHCSGVDCRYHRHSSFLGLINDDIAGQKQSDVDLLLQSLVCERWIAGAENHIVAEIHT